MDENLLSRPTVSGGNLDGGPWPFSPSVEHRPGEHINPEKHPAAADIAGGLDSWNYLLPAVYWEAENKARRP